MDRLVALEPMAGSTDGTGAFPAHVFKECDDWDDEAHDDSTYRADFSDLPEGADEPSPFMWRDLFELNIALREASRVYHDPAILSAIEKIEGATSSYVQVEMATNETMLADVSAAVEDHQQIKILYTAATADEARTPFDRAARDQGPQRPHLRAGLLHDPRIVANLPGGPDQRRRRQLRRHRGAPAGHRRQLAHPGRRGGRRGRRRHRRRAALALRAAAQRAVADARGRAPRRQVPRQQRAVPRPAHAARR